MNKRPDLKTNIDCHCSTLSAHMLTSIYSLAVHSTYVNKYIGRPLGILFYSLRTSVSYTVIQGHMYLVYQKQIADNWTMQSYNVVFTL